MWHRRVRPNYTRRSGLTDCRTLNSNVLVRLGEHEQTRSPRTASSGQPEHEQLFFIVMNAPTFLNEDTLDRFGF